ncbi:GNAT family N-acetyltransferase [Virgibacillus flavescens]|uniref:GNAT family N-acetyltransferase n=1 Tax=Virgibacillus flavescens TaxID=1611422 RepID=UPI003D329D23
MDLALKKLQIEDAESLFEFELDNRTYFEQMVPSRGDEYFGYESFQNRLDSLLDEQTKEISYFYLIKDSEGSILGRINLVDIDEPRSMGHLGYRIGEIHVGKRIASRSLKLLLEKVLEEINIKQINAKTTTNNIASQKVLENNGFEQEGLSDESIELNGQKLKFVNYTWRAKE